MPDFAWVWVGSYEDGRWVLGRYSEGSIHKLGEYYQTELGLIKAPPLWNLISIEKPPGKPVRPPPADGNGRGPGGRKIAMAA